VTVCGGTGCRAGRGLAVANEFRKQLELNNLADSVEVRTTGCHGFCQQGPLVVLRPKGLMYVNVKPEHVEEIVHTASKETVSSRN